MIQASTAWYTPQLPDMTTTLNLPYRSKMSPQDFTKLCRSDSRRSLQLKFEQCTNAKIGRSDQLIYFYPMGQCSQFWSDRSGTSRPTTFECTAMGSVLKAESTSKVLL